MSSILIIVNPVSGHGRGPLIVDALKGALERRGFAVAVEKTAHAGDGTRIAAAARDTQAVLAVGGDGTINEVVGGLVGRALPLGIVPLGTANVIAKEFGHTRDPEAVCAMVERNRVRAIDLIEVREDDGRLRRYATAMAGAGYDAHIVQAFHGRRRGPMIGHAMYVSWGFSMMLDYRVPSMRVEVDGREVDGDASFVVVANTRKYAGPLTFAPEAAPDDGWLDVYRYHALGRFDYLRAFFFAMIQRPLWSGRGAITRGREIRLTVNHGHVPMQVDGDPAGAAPARLRVLPGALPLLTPV